MQKNTDIHTRCTHTCSVCAVMIDDGKHSFCSCVAFLCLSIFSKSSCISNSWDRDLLHNSGVIFSSWIDSWEFLVHMRRPCYCQSVNVTNGTQKRLLLLSIPGYERCEKILPSLFVICSISLPLFRRLYRFRLNLFCNLLLSQAFPPHSDYKGP